MILVTYVKTCEWFSSFLENSNAYKYVSNHDSAEEER